MSEGQNRIGPESDEPAVLKRAGLYVSDVTDPAVPVEFGSYDSGVYSTSGIGVARDYNSATDSTGLWVIDASGSTAPVMHVRETIRSGLVFGVAVDGSTFCVAEGDSRLTDGFEDGNTSRWLQEVR